MGKVFFDHQLFFSLLFSFVLFSCVTSVRAQQNNMWTFGDSAGVDFNTNPPTTFQSSVSSNEGVASICNDQGRLLFYTDGVTAWDRYHEQMPNGADLPRRSIPNLTSSTSQGATIVPIPGSSNEYYIFSLSAQEAGPGRLYYCKVDMRLNNGRGDVVSGTRGQLLATGLSEHLTAVAGDQCDVWLIVTTEDFPASEIKAYHITQSGIGLVPVLSPKIPFGSTTATGCADISPDRSMLALAQRGGNLTVYDFNPTTGVSTSPTLLDEAPYYYGVAFSPDNSKLYASAFYYTYQFDLSLPTTADIIASKTVITENFGYYISRAPDGKMYISHGGQNALSVIINPNASGMACDYQHNGLALSAGNTTVGLPNSNVASGINKYYYSSSWDTIKCMDFAALEARNVNASGYTWQDGSSGTTFTADTSGTYWVSYGIDCELFIDTFYLTLYKNKRIYSATELDALCAADTVLLEAQHDHAFNYVWEDQSPGMKKVARHAGTYWVTYSIDSLCEYYADTFEVHYPAKDPELSFDSDSIVCTIDQVFFQNTSDPLFNRFDWRFGDGSVSDLLSPQHQYTYAGRYDVRLRGSIDGKCLDSVTRQVVVDSLFLVRYTSDRKAICQGQAIQFYPEVDTPTIALHWHYSADEVLVSNDKYMVQHAFSEPGIYPVWLRAINRACPDTSYMDSIRVYPLPEIDLGVDSSICLHGAPVYLKNLRTAPLAPYHQLWSTGDTTGVLKVVHPGIYTLSVTTQPIGCTTTESIEIIKDCYIDIPNAFTPNGDGQNDYFLPRQLLSESLTRFHMQVFNRWGQIVFETTQIDGRGWDGRFNDRAQPMGVYVYRIEAYFANGRAEAYEGNVTLIR